MMTGVKTYILIGFLAVLILAGVALGYTIRSGTPLGGGAVACTDEAKICPDGSAVGRTRPNCEFAACPAATSTGNSSSVVGAGEHCGGFIQNAPVCATGFHCQLVPSRPDTGGMCVADTTNGGVGEYHSGVLGTVLLGPSCPVVRNPPDPQCADKPYATSITVFRSNNKTNPVATTQSNADGGFELALAPGSYYVAAGGSSTLPRCAGQDVTVGADTYTSVTVSCDTGIR